MMNESEPLVSIIIPVYNAANYLEETIHSALNQTWKNKEIILVDDGSTDRSLTIAQKYESDNVKVFSQPNSGASAARNKGLAESSGSFIQFLDADDLIDPSKIENQLNVIKGVNGAVAYGPFSGFKTSDNLPPVSSFIELSYTNGRDFLFALYGGDTVTEHAGGMVAVHCWLTPKNVINKSGNWNEQISVDDDGEFFCRVALNAGSVVYVDSAKSYYRSHPHNKNLSGQTSYNAYLSSFRALQLKSQSINDKKFNGLIANLAIQLLVGIFPNHVKLRREIEKYIKHLGGGSWQPYHQNPHKLFRKIFGWRFVKLLTYYKNK